MKNNKVLGALLTAGFCASTMMACGVYGAPEDYEDINVTEAEETENSGMDIENDGTEYYPDKEEETSVYGAPEDYE